MRAHLLEDAVAREKLCKTMIGDYLKYSLNLSGKIYGSKVAVPSALPAAEGVAADGGDASVLPAVEDAPAPHGDGALVEVAEEEGVAVMRRVETQSKI